MVQVSDVRMSGRILLSPPPPWSDYMSGDCNHLSDENCPECEGNSIDPPSTECDRMPEQIDFRLPIPPAAQSETCDICHETLQTPNVTMTARNGAWLRTCAKSTCASEANRLLETSDPSALAERIAKMLFTGPMGETGDELQLVIVGKDRNSCTGLHGVNLPWVVENVRRILEEG